LPRRFASLQPTTENREFGKSNGVKINSSIQAPPIALHLFCQNTGITPITAWRWRGKGWLNTVNISGRQYVTAESAAEFNRRATAGEFSSEHKVPRRAKSQLL